ncbi:hypothetical protein [Dysgonomonas mossii]|uniref:hypothetical protein n=1 Tax=Dysgonomonas mossii TaxID=163665 RepID=UPI00399679CC
MNEAKDDIRLNQLQRVRKLLKERPLSMREVANILGEERENICRYVGMLRDSGQIQVHHRAECMTTGHVVNFYTCNEVLFRPDNQLKLFEDEK